MPVTNKVGYPCGENLLMKVVGSGKGGGGGSVGSNGKILAVAAAGVPAGVVMAAVMAAVVAAA